LFFVKYRTHDMIFNNTSKVIYIELKGKLKIDFYI
jgi:hypothetical protein